MLASGQVTKNMAMEFKNGLMVLSTKECGKTIRLVVKESFGMQMAIFTKVNGLKIKQTELEFTTTLTALHTLANGKTIISTVKVRKAGLTAVATTAFIAMVKSMDEAFTGGQMDQSMKESGLTTGLKAKALTTGQMEESSQVIG